MIKRGIGNHNYKIAAAAIFVYEAHGNGTYGMHATDATDGTDDGNGTNGTNGTYVGQPIGLYVASVPSVPFSP